MAPGLDGVADDVEDNYTNWSGPVKRYGVDA